MLRPRRQKRAAATGIEDAQEDNPAAPLKKTEPAPSSAVDHIERLKYLHADLDRLPHPRVIAFVAGKGGAGKTSTSANFAAMAAAAGYRVLVVDLDTQANQSVLFGVADDDPLLDQGKGLLGAIVSEEPSLVRPLRDVRPGVDLVPAGTNTRKLSDFLTLSQPQERQRQVRGMIEQIAIGYDLVVVDSRPAGEILGEVALFAADYLVMPTRTDAMSWNQGYNTIAALHDQAGATARLLGVVIFGTGRGSTKIQADTRAQLEAKLDGTIPVFNTMIYHSEKAAKDQSEEGLLADEYAAAAVALAKPFWEDPSAPRFATGSSAAADNYAALAVEIIEAILR